MQLYPFQKQAVKELLDGKRIAVIPTGGGKSAVMFAWLQALNPQKVLVVTTCSKRDSGDMLTEADKFAGKGWRDGRQYEVIAWSTLHKWVFKEHILDLKDWTICLDEIHNGKSGVSSQRGRAFLKLAKECRVWSGYTATPGDRWIDLCAYFIACDKLKNKTQFQREYCLMQTFRGFPEIKGYTNTKELKQMWQDITTIPNAEQMFRELPSEQHIVHTFKQPKDYKQVIKTSMTTEGEPLESNMALAHYVRQLCYTKQKHEWIADFMANTPEPIVFFYNYRIEQKELERAFKESGRKGRIWHVNGEHHEIPTADTISKGDIVVAQYVSGSAALNLQFMRHWVSVSPNYSYTISIQARGRIKRIGQTQNMLFQYLKCEDTIEDDVYSALKNKRDFSEEAWEPKH